MHIIGVREEGTGEPPSPRPSLRLDAASPAVVPSTPLRGFVGLRAKLDGQPFHPSRRTARCQGAIPSSMAGSGSDKWIAELWMAILP